MRAWLCFLAILLGGAPLGPALGQDAPDRGEAFVAEFAAGCLPARGSFEGIRQSAPKQGWTAVAPETEPELAALIALGEETVGAMSKPTDMAFALDRQAFVKQVLGRDLHLLVIRVAAEGGAYVSCYLYDLAATEPMDSGPVNAIIGASASEAEILPELHHHTWNQPSSFPGALDVHLTFVAEGGPFREELPFSGLVLMLTSRAAP